MPYKQNILKQERIDRYGVTVDLPLFNQEKTIPVQYQNLPDWIWNGNSIKAEIYNKMKEKFAQDSLEYLNAVIALGGNTTDHEVREYFNDESKWTAAIISARRNYFLNGPFYIITSFPDPKNPDKPISRPGPKGKPNTVWYIDYKKLYMLLLD